jgi:hypothetical protein
MILLPGVVSLYDMLKFAAESFWKASQALTELRENPASIGKPMKGRDTVQTLQELTVNLQELDLPVSIRELVKFNHWMNAYVKELMALPTEQSKAAFLKNESVVKTKLEQVASVIHSELESRLFFHVQQNHARYYDQKELFGAAVNAKFPNAQYDMVEAGNCCALGRSTACVFHLMRIMEVGVQQFGTKLGVTLAQEKNWQNILDEINKAIKALPPKATETVQMSQAAANLFSVKLAWRNEVMHPNDTYTLEEAENLIGQVKLFMGQLAEIV